MHTVHEIAAAWRWEWEQGAQRELWFERVEGLKEDKHGNMVKVIEWSAKLEVWGNYELTDGDLIHGWDMKPPDVHTLDVAPSPDWIGKVQGDGTSGDMVTIVCANKPPILHIRRWWCCVLPKEAAIRSLREEIRTGEAWNALLNATRQEPRLSNNLPAEDQQILRHFVEHHNLNPSQALAVRQCLDEGAVVSSMTGGGRHGEVGDPGGLHQGSDVAAGVLRPMHPESQGAGFDTHWHERGGGGPTDNPPRACILVIAPTNAQVENLMLRVIQSAEQDLVFSHAVLKDHPVPRMRLRAARGRTPPGLEPYNQTTVQETLANRPDCNGTLQCALNSCQVLFATAGMVATRRKLLLPGDPQTRFAFSFVDESSGHSILVGLDLAAFGAQCMFCGDAGQPRPYSAISLLAAAAKAEGDKKGKGGKMTAQHIAWPQSEHFANLHVHLDQGPGMQYGDSQRCATSSVLQFVLYRTRCTACVLTEKFRMDLPVATVVRGLFTGGSLGWYPASSPALPPPVLGGQHIRIVSTDDPESISELTRYGMSDARVGLLRREVGRAWECLVMDEAMRTQGNTSREEAWLVLHFLEHAQSANVYPPKSVAIVTTRYAQMLRLQHCVWEAGRRLHGDQAYECVHRNFYVFSSIPTERRNLEFKMDIRHSFQRL